jgi:hypothetical protein
LAPEARALIIKQLAAALADAWRRQHQSDDRAKDARPARLHDQQLAEPAGGRS